MPNLLWKKNKLTNKLLSTPFKSEEEFETFILHTPEILDEIHLIHRQVETGGKAGIPDIIGIDNEGTVCIIEMKNVKVDSSIIPQVLKYAIWAESNPDSIRALWLETKDPPDIEINWDKLQVKVIIIAPNILPSTLQFVDKIHYVVELLEINLWREGNNNFILVNKLEQETTPTKIKSSKGLPEYDRKYYERYHKKESVRQFYKYIGETEKIIKQKEWSLEAKFNKDNVSFKAGFFYAFRIRWIDSKTLAFVFSIAKSHTNRFKHKLFKYNAYNKAVYLIEPGKTKTEDFTPLFAIAYNKLTGD